MVDKETLTLFKGRGWKIGCLREGLHSTEPKGHGIDDGSPQELEFYPLHSHWQEGLVSGSGG